MFCLSSTFPFICKNKHYCSVFIGKKEPYAFQYHMHMTCALKY